MFSALMANTWLAATLVAVVAGVVGFFTVMRGSSFAAHALPNGAFAGAAGATLIGTSTLLGLGTFSVAGALAIAALGRRARNDVATALVMAAMLGLGALFLSVGHSYAPEVDALLFGQILAVSNGQVEACVVMGALTVLAVVAMYRPLLFSSVSPDVAEARGVRAAVVETLFLLVVALVTTMAVPVVGALLIFALLVGPAASARAFTSRPEAAVALSVLIALIVVWASVAVAYETNLPVGFLVGALVAVAYVAGRLYTWSRGGNG